MTIPEIISQVLGLHLEPRNLSFVQVSLRSIIVFVTALIMVRVAAKRFLAKLTALDAILGFVLASMLARAVNGSSSFFPTLGGGFVLVFVHRLLSELAYRSRWVESLIKGEAELLIKDGKIQRAAARRNYMTASDIEEELRLRGSIECVEKAKAAFIERDGEISVVK